MLLGDASLRRQDKEITDTAALEEALDAADWGTLGLVSEDGRAVLVPLNFVRHEGRLYFHGALAGQKMEILRQRGEATFLVVDAFAQIPSYASDPRKACPATQFYKSVIAYGQVRILDEPALKAEALGVLMGKLQPDGGYQPIDAEGPLYRASISSVAVMEMTVERMTGKFAFGQMFSAERWASVTNLLETRGGPQDRRTLEAMAKFGAKFDRS
jgi:uncharacterized protein